MSVGETFFEELTAEKLVTKRNKYGVPSKTWEQIRERNESLDCFVLSLAALRILAPTPARFTSAAERIEQMRLGVPISVPSDARPPRESWLRRRSDGELERPMAGG